jgi:hypothetical protein
MNLCPPLPFASDPCPSQRLRTQSFRTCCSLLVIAGAAALTSGCIQAKAEVPEVEITRQNIQVPATPATVPDGTVVTLDMQFQYDQAPVSLPDSVTMDVRATEFTISLRKGPANLSFVHEVSLTVSKAGGHAETVVAYKKGAEPVGSLVTIPVQGDPKLLDPWSVADSTFVLKLVGELPKQEWSVDLSIKFSGSLSYSM